jgi:integrase
MVCKSAAIEYRWINGFDPFFGFRKLPEGDPYEKIMPFSLEEQKKLLEEMPQHWRPYFKFAFCSGLRVGEQLALKPGDIDWDKKTVNIRRAFTLDENGQRIVYGKYIDKANNSESLAILNNIFKVGFGKDD